MNKNVILAIDQGSSGTRAFAVDASGAVLYKRTEVLCAEHPREGYAQYDAAKLLESQLVVLNELLDKLEEEEVSAIAVSSQRSTVVLWNRRTGEPLAPALSWQDGRASKEADAVSFPQQDIHKLTGLYKTPFYSAAKIAWCLKNIPAVQKAAQKGELAVGPVATYLIWRLTNGEVFAIDPTLAQRTLLFNIHTLKWDKEILRVLKIPQQILPEVKPSSHVYGYTDSKLFGREVPIAGAGGDQQCALFGQTCFERGEVKNTYGTGGFMLMNTGTAPVNSHNGLVTTIAWGVDDKVEYALEGSIFVAGAAVQWLRDELGLIRDAAESEVLAKSVPDANGCYVVPAFVGLGAPYWDQYARGAIVGLTRGVNRNHIVRATLESIAYQVNDVLMAMQEDSGMPITSLRVDGGACDNDFLMQFQADILNTSVVRPYCIETTAMGAAYLAGLAVGYWRSKEEILANHVIAAEFKPQMGQAKRESLLQGWHNAVKAASVRI